MKAVYIATFIIVGVLSAWASAAAVYGYYAGIFTDMQLIRLLLLYSAMPTAVISGYLLYQGRVKNSRKPKIYGYMLLAIYLTIAFAVGIPSMIEMINRMTSRAP